jgi:FkbM family methyltransferase
MIHNVQIYIIKTGGSILRLPVANKLINGPLKPIYRKVSHASIRNPVISNGLSYYYNPDDRGLAFELFEGNYEKETMEVFKNLVHSGMTVVDLGANIGYYAINAAQIVGNNGRVYAFEPNTPTYQILVRNVMANKYDAIITPIPKAAWSEKATLSFWIDEKDSGSSSVFGALNRQKTDRVEAVSMDDFFKEQGWPNVDVIKMDIEGAEKAALRGMREVIHRNEGIKLIMEFNARIQKEIGLKNDELTDELIGIGFRKISIIKNGLYPINIPEDVPLLMKIAGNEFVNLLCEK